MDIATKVEINTHGIAATKYATRVAKPSRARIIPRTDIEVYEARATRWDTLSPLKVIALTCLASALIHATMLALGWLGSAREPATKVHIEKIEMAVIEQVDTPRPLPKPKKRAQPVVPPPPPVEAPVAPPPPVVGAVKPTPPPVLVTGISLSSTSAKGSFKVGVGNTLHGEIAEKATAPETVKPYKAAEYAPLYLVTEMPEYLENLSAKQKNSFYPPEAKKLGIEAEVRVKIIIDDDGSVVQAIALNDPGHGFAAAAVRLAKALKFRPARVNGRYVATELERGIPFVVEHDE
ncbi:MAG: TonB family protein [Gammaproteobacteria bacterium]|nr:TonB family protein [Gammaproteobacteria bacterium]